MLPSPCLPQALVTFEDVAVRFSAEEWATLAGWQQALHKEVMEETARLLLSLGQSVPALALLSLTDHQEAAGRLFARDAVGRDLSGDGGEERAFPGDYPDADVPWDLGQVEEDGSPPGTQEGEPQGSLHLSALMKLVKEIPEFLFGTSKAPADPAEAAGSSDAATSTEPAGVKTEEPPETPHPPGLESGAMDVALSWPSHPDTPASSVSTSSAEGNERGSPPGSLYADIPMENSPLQGLLNCLKEIPTHLSDMQGDRGQTRLEMETRAWQATGSNDSCRTGADPWPVSAVKTEVMAESSPLQSLENCLRDLAAAERPSHPGTPESSPCNGSSRQEQEQVQVQRSLELRAGRCPSEVQAAAGTPDTMSDQPGDRQGRPSSSSSAEGEREQRGLPRCQEAAVPAEESPLQGLLNCLKEILVRAPRCPPSPPSRAVSGRAPGESLPSLHVKTEAALGAPHGPGSHRALASCSTSTGRAAGQRCLETLGRSCWGEGAVKTEGSAAHSPPRGPSSGWTEARRLVKTEAGTEDATWQSRLQCSEHAAACRPCAPSALPGPVSPHSPDGDKALWRVPLGPWHLYPQGGRTRQTYAGICAISEAEPTPGTSPLHGLVNCLKEIPVPSASLSSLAGAEATPMRAWPGEDVSAESSPLRGLENCLKDIPIAQPRQVHLPVCLPCGSPLQRPPGMAWRSLGEDLGAETSPLQGLENCLKEIPVAVHSRCVTPASRSSVGSTPEGHRGPELATRPLKAEVKIEALPESSRLHGPGSSEKEVPHYPSKPASCSVEGDLGLRPADAGAWHSYVDAGAATEDTPPLRGLENCLKDIPVPRPRCPNAAAGPLRASLAQADVEQRRAAPWPWGASAGAQAASPITWAPPCALEMHRLGPDAGGSGLAPPAAGDECPLLRGLISSWTEVPVCGPSTSSTASAGSTETEPDPRSPGIGMWSRCHNGASPQSSPLQGLQNCLRDLAAPAGCTASPPAANGPAGRGVQRKPKPWLCTLDAADAAPKHSPLHGLENCLRDLVSEGRSGSSNGDVPKPEMWAPQEEIGYEMAAGSPCPGPEGPPTASPARREAPSSPAQGEEDTSTRGTVAREAAASNGPKSWVEDSAVHSPHCSSTEDQELRRLELGAGRCCRGEATRETSPLHSLLGCLKEIRTAGPSPSHAPDSSSSAHGTRCNRAQERMGSRAGTPSGEVLPSEVGPADAPRYSAASCAERPPGNEAGCSDAQCGMSAGSAQVRGCLRRPEKGSKRPHPAAQGDAARLPRSSSRGPDASEQQTEAEWDTSPKKQCPTAAPSESCSCESHTPQVFQVETGHFQAVLSEKLDRISEDVATLCRDVSSMRRRMARLEQEARGWAREATALRKGSQGLSKTLRRLEHRCRALETRARRNNLRLLGLPEGTEGGDAIAFLQTALPGMLGLPADVPALEIESARRVPGGTRCDPAATARPRALVFRLLRLADKAAVLRAVRKRVEPLVWGGTRVAIFPDVCPKLSRRRRARHTAGGHIWRAAELRVSPRPSGCPRGRRELLPGPMAGTWDREEREGRDPSGH
ncbi:uncharacterized protein LOC109282729 isoform X5 [Alligator mississippiensis]|uniref:uncharacterized protein LOC109282729 isoform X5 n=1 Tax=Alligator mississippiensis TaxID=8496 RepID=UPI002877505B|nr:uncharacterized protein LOC109282729 isoform X5 [Alligator mississippiensis]